MRYDSFVSANHGSMAATSFASAATSGEAVQTPTQQMLEPESVIPSPPISPEKIVEKDKSAQEQSQVNGVVVDPPAYAPSEAGESVASNIPLFPSNVATSDESDRSAPSVDSQSVIDSHIAARNAHSTRTSPTPTKEEYAIALGVQKMQSNVLELFMKDPKAYWEREKSLWDSYRVAAQKKQQRDLEKQRQRKLLPKDPLKKVASTPAFKRPRQPAAPRAQRTPRQITQNSSRDPWAPLGIREYVPTPPRAPRPPVVRGDFEWRSIPDYCPPANAPEGRLKTDWKGQPLDLSNDPDRDNLTSDEIRLASTLRLSCAAYLHSKRNIFRALLEKMRIGKEFRKTDAQQACSIDVNKASKLWTAFEKVGWFHPDHFRKYD